MPIILAVIAALGGAYIWYLRAQAAKDAAETLADAANDVRLAARRFGFRRKTNVHPIDAVEDAQLLIVGITAAMAQLDRAWNTDLQKRLAIGAQKVLRVDSEEAAEMVVFGQWLADQSADGEEAVRRMAKRLRGMGQAEARVQLGEMLAFAVADADGAFSDRVVDAIGTLNRHMG